jgi:CelD/BcsL family acetyltransferase involved in cellulose biosynthesis
MTQVTVIEHEAALAALSPEWNQLLQASAAASAFLTFEWVSVWWRHFGRGRRLWIVTVRSGGELIAIAPFVRCPRRIRPPRLVPVLEFIGSAGTFGDHLDLIVKAGREAEAAEAVADALCGAGLAIDLDGMSADSSAAGHLEAALARRGWVAGSEPADTCPFITLGGVTFDDYLARLARKHRSNFRRGLRNLTGQFDVQFDLVTSEAAREEAFAALVRLHLERWQDRGGSGAFTTGAQVAFHDELTRRFLDRGWLRLCVLRVRGAIAAVLYGMSYHGRFSFYQSGFDTSFQQHSIGLLTIGLSIEQATREGSREFDLLRGTETYKFRWARETRQLRRFEASPPDVAHAIHRATVRAWRLARRVVRGPRFTARPAGQSASPDSSPGLPLGGPADLEVSEEKAGTAR